MSYILFICIFILIWIKRKIKEMFIFEELVKEKYVFKLSVFLYFLS